MKIKKEHDQNKIRNLQIKRKIREAKKLAQKSLQAKKKDAPQKVKEVIILVDKAAKNNIIHKNKANRIKSKLQEKLAKLKLELPKKVKTKKPVRRSLGVGGAKGKTASKKTEAQKKTKKKQVRTKKSKSKK